MGQNLRRILVKRAMAGLLLLAAVNIYVIGQVGVSTFPTALNGTTVSCAPNAISPQVETPSTTPLGRGSRKVVEDFTLVFEGLTD